MSDHDEDYCQDRRLRERRHVRKITLESRVSQSISMVRNELFSAALYSDIPP